MFKKKFRKFFLKFLTIIKLKSLQRRSITTLRYNPIGGKKFLLCSCIKNQQDITVSLITMKTTTKTGKTQNSVEKCEKKFSKPLVTNS